MKKNVRRQDKPKRRSAPPDHNEGRAMELYDFFKTYPGAECVVLQHAFKYLAIAGKGLASLNRGKIMKDEDIIGQMTDILSKRGITLYASDYIKALRQKTFDTPPLQVVWDASAQTVTLPSPLRPQLRQLTPSWFILEPADPT